ncbi:MAG: translocation/assembly module TamB domain-containing protein [Vicinamibacterales bacterium]
MRVNVPRRLAWAAATLAGLAGVLIVLAHTPAAGRWGLQWLIRQAAARSIDLSAGRLRVNLFTRRITLEDLRLAAEGHAGDPFFTAGRVSAQLPWAVLTGALRVSMLDVSDAHVRLVRENGVLVNLPPSSGAPPPLQPRRFDVRGLRLSTLDLDYLDRTADAEVTVRGVTAALDERVIRVFAGASGSLRADQLHVRLADHDTTSGAIEGRLAFDGSNVSLQALTVPLPEGRIVVGGRIERVLDDTQLALTLDGSLDFAPLAAWVPPPTPVAGAGSFKGGMTGPLGDYVLAASFASDALHVGRAADLRLNGELRLTPDRADVQPFTVTAPSRAAADPAGVIEGAFTYTFETRSSDMTATFRDVDLDVALAAADVDAAAVAAREDGRVTIRMASPEAPMSLRATGVSRALIRANRIPVAGTWTAVLDRDRWSVQHDHRLLETVRASGTVSWPDTGTPSASPFTGPLNVDIGDVGRTAAAAARAGFAVPEAVANISGPAEGRFSMRGTLERPGLSGRLQSRALTLPSGQVATLEADVAYDGDALAAGPFAFTTPGARASGQVTARLDSGRLSGRFDADADDLGTLLDVVRPGTAASGTLALHGTIAGTTEVPDVPLTLDSTIVMVEGQRIGTVHAEARLLGTSLQVSRLSVTQDPGTLTASGRFDYATGAYDLTLDGRDLRLERPLAGASIEAVRANAAFSGAGTLAAPGGSGALILTPVGGSFGELLGDTDIRFQFSGGLLNATGYLPNVRTLVQATLDPHAPYVYRGVAAVSALDVQPVALAIGALPEAISGTVGASASFEGRLDDPSSAQAFVNLQALDLAVGGLPVTLERPARLTLRPASFGVDDLAVRAGATTLEASGRLDDPADRALRATVDGTLGDVVALARAFALAPRGLTASGAIRGEWESRGGFDRATAALTLDDASIGVEDLPPVQALSATAAYDGTVVTVDGLRATWQGGEITGRARVPRAVLEAVGAGAAGPPGRVEASVRGLTQQALAPWLPADALARLEGRVSATLGLDVRALSVAGLRGTLVLDEAAATAAGVPVAQVRPSRLSMDGGTLSFDDVAFNIGAPVTVAGTVTVAEATTLALRVTGRPQLRPFSVLATNTALDGSAIVDLAIGGTTAAPLVTGRVEFDQAEASLRDPVVLASGTTGALVFDGERVRAENIHGSLNGGDFDLGGTVRVLGVEEPTGQLTLQMRGVAVEYPANVNSEVDALLTFVPGPGEPTLRGDVRVLRGAYRATISLPALVAFNATRPAVAAEDGYLGRLRLDLSLTTEDDLVIDNNYGRFEAGANLRLQGTGERPAVTGRVELREGGEVFVLGGLYRLSQSTISFTNPNAIEPDLNITLVTRSSGAEQTLTLSGTLDRLQTSVVSSDPSADASLASLLLGEGSLDRERALQLLSGELLGVTGRAIGLDSLRVERGFDVGDVRQDPGLIADIQDPTTRLTLSKALRPNVEVVLSQGIGQGALSGYVLYQPFRGVELRATSLDNTDRLYSVRHDISFGAAAPSAASRREPPRVGTVSIDGVEPLEENAIRDRLKLDPGSRFDFIRWRDDVDRVRGYFRERAYLEARVRGARSETAGTVALTYSIQQGPPTDLRVDGADVSRDLRRRLETAWANSVFDRFLRDEIRRLILLDLVRKNVIGAEVDTDVTEAPPVKVIHVVVRGGQVARGRRIAYSGATAIPPAELDGELAARGIDDQVWLDPHLLSDAVSDYYASQGYRAARVTVNAPVIVGGREELPVLVDEGPVTRVTSATLEGSVDALAAATAPLATALEGHPYRRVDVDAAARQIERRYQGEGYNDVRVTTQVAAPPDAATAAVTFHVEPGREQRLADVVVTGTTRTRPQAVINALRLEPGEPIDLSRWAEARRRVFDTNVFRQVDVRPEVLPEPNPDGTEAVRARVTVAEWPAWRLRYGLQLDDRAPVDQGEDTSVNRKRDLGVVANLQNRNVFGRAFTFGIYGQAARRLQSTNAYLTFPTLFGRAVQTNVFVSSSRQDVATDASNEFFLRRSRRLLSLEQRIRRGRSFEFVYGYRLKREIIDALDPEDPFYLAPLVGRLTTSAFFDRRDDPFNATRGWFGAVSAERVSEFESGADAVKIQGTYFGYRGAGPLLFASAVRVGGSFLGDLGFSERFYVGGSDTVRGYGEGLVGPKTFTGSARGGDALLILNEELRAPIYKWVRGVAFVDAGNVFASNGDIRLSRLEVGYGVGLRLHTPFSIFRIDLGVPTTGARTIRWYFGLGQVF